MSATVTFLNHPVKLLGKLPQPGEYAKPFKLVSKDLANITLGNYAGKRKVLNIFPSIDTEVCAASVRRFNSLANDIANTVVLCISCDMPFAQARFCGNEGLS
ncbi:thiol peroxidase, partial [Serratia marcescens]|uniref:thiol peroxidase n=1 Tax=Serratia marcescens TaxID=615 RepID=UPI0011E6A3CF